MSRAGSGTTRRRRARSPCWAQWERERLLDLRLCDLGVHIDGTWVEELADRVCQELTARGLRLRPHFWLSDEWFCPHGVPGVAVPFYLAHPRLLRLEREMMLEAEGGTRRECMKLLRHEVGHAVQHAYELHRRRRWQQLFGKSSEPYPTAYLPDPFSREHVQHLDDWYAQSHPVEDFAETFAVWLGPRARWRRRYADWPALEKLEYVDELMREIAGTAPRVRNRTRPDSLPRLRRTLRSHYREKRERYSIAVAQVYDRDLCRLFTPADVARGEGVTAAAFLRRHRREIRTLVSRWTGQYQYTLDEVLEEMGKRCRQLGLRAVRPERELMLDFAILLTVHTVHHIFVSPEWRSL